MKKSLAIVAIAALLGGLVATSAVSAADVADNFVIDYNKKGKKCDLSHKKHVDLVGSCKECHHMTEEGKTPKKCATCHKKKKEGDVIDIKKAYHKQCIDCHKKEKKGPRKCKECHPKKK